MQALRLRYPLYRSQNQPFRSMQNTTNSSRSPALIRLPSIPAFYVPSVADGISYLLLACTDSATSELAIRQLIDAALPW